jgi:hypothetical protein
MARNNDVELAFPNLSLFAQDTWKATRTLTITLRCALGIHCGAGGQTGGLNPLYPIGCPRSALKLMF